MNDLIRAESDAFVALIEETDESRFNPVRVKTHDGVAVAFYRRTATATTDVPRLSPLYSMRKLPVSGTLWLRRKSNRAAHGTSALTRPGAAGVMKKTATQ
jgi:hypothetical protein